MKSHAAMKLHNKFFLFFGVLFTISLLTSCNPTIELYPTKPGQAILQILKKDNQYSLAVEALDRAKLSVLLNTYGNYTFFAPTNDAFKKYLTSKNVTTVSQLDIEELRSMLLYHLYNAAYPSTTFINGSLPSMTASKEYIAMDISEGLENVFLNDSVKVVALDLMATNGVCHGIDGILYPPNLSIYALIKANPSFTIITKAIEQTGLQALLEKSDSIMDSVSTRLRYTFFAEPDSVFINRGIHSFEELAAKYSNTNQYTSTDDSLNHFVRYHIIETNKFISDFKDEYLETLSLTDYVVFSVSPQISLNKHKITLLDQYGIPYTKEIEVKIKSQYNNIIAKNGVIHSVDQPFEIYLPEATYLRVSFINDCGYFPTCNGSIGFKTAAQQDTIPWLKWYPPTADARVRLETRELIYGNLTFQISMPDATHYVELTTPPIFKGKYNVHFSFSRNSGSAQMVQPFFDGLPTSTQINMQTDRQNEMTERKDSRQQLLLTTQIFYDIVPHTIRFQCVSAGTFFFDCIEFIPVIE